MFEASRKVINLIWVGIAALISLIAGLIIHKSNKEIKEMDKVTQKLTENSAKREKQLNKLEELAKEAMKTTKEDLESIQSKVKERERYEELVKRLIDLTLSPEENLQASIELTRLNGVPEDEIIKTPEEGKKYFTE